MFSHVGDSGWIWCSRCARCYIVAEARRTETLRMCAYEDCDGHLAIDGFPWSVVQRRHRQLPDVPERAVCYPNLINVEPTAGPCTEQANGDDGPYSSQPLQDFL